MSLKINQEVWVYVERLYIYCYDKDQFKNFLKQHGVDYDNPNYDSLLEKSGEANKIPLYKFMSEINWDFAHFMQTVPTYKYLSILQRIIFDPKIIETRKDGWNYYREPVREWHQKIIDQIKLSGAVIDIQNKKIQILEPEEDFGSIDFLPYDFNDLFLDYIRKEINESYNNGQLLAVVILSRKLLEALIIRIFEVYFPKIVSGTYQEANHSLWYNKTQSRHHGLENLIMNLRARSVDFHEDKDLVEDVCILVEQVRIEANKCVHKDYKIPDEELLKKIKIESAVISIRKLFKKYCNP